MLHVTGPNSNFQSLEGPCCPIQSLENDTLLKIVESIEDATDIKSMRLACTRLDQAVRESAIQLRPYKEITLSEMNKLGRVFRNTATLSLFWVPNLRRHIFSGGFKGVEDLFPHLRQATP